MGPVEGQERTSDPVEKRRNRSIETTEQKVRSYSTLFFPFNVGFRSLNFDVL